MREIGVFFGTCTNRTAGVAEDLAERLGVPDEHLHDIFDCTPEDLLRYRCILAGSPTWESAALPRDWLRVTRAMDRLDLSGRRVALFGLGDGVGYPDSFVDAIGLLHDAFTAAGATCIGRWPSAGYRFRHSLALDEDGRFHGLALDLDNDEAGSPALMDAWVAQLRTEFV